MEDSFYQMQREHIEGLLEQLGASCNCSDMIFDDDDFCAIHYGENVVVNLYYDAPSTILTAFTQIAYYSTLEHKEKILTEALKAQFFWRKTRGFSIAVDEESDSLVLQDKRRVDFFQTKDDLEDFIRNAGELTEIIRDKLNLLEDDFRDVTDEEDTIPADERDALIYSFADDNDSFNSNWLKV